MPYFKYNDKSCYYNETGSGQPLVLLHGNAASSKMFDYITGEYRDEYKVIVIDFLGHGRSDRLEAFPADLWYDEAMQAIALLEQKKYKKVNLIGTSGGALVAINAALERPELINKVVADSFEGESALNIITDSIEKERELSKQSKDSIEFYEYMHGSGWEQVVDNDTAAIVRHANEVKRFFHKPLTGFKPEILMTATEEDEFTVAAGKDFFIKTYNAMLDKIGHGEQYIFKTGRHPAMLSNAEEFIALSRKFFSKQ